MKELNRRDFLRAGGVLVLGGGLAVKGGVLAYGSSKLSQEVARGLSPYLNKDPTFKVEFDKNNEKLSFEECSRLALRFDKILDGLEEPFIPLTTQSLQLLTIEATPYFAYEGAVDEAKYPDFARPHGFPNAQHVHVGGRSNCESYVVNYSFANPFSGRHGKNTWIHTAIHEMVHVQQGDLCATPNKELLEATAQIVSYEVMAGMSNYGNKAMVYPLLSELRGMAAGAAWGISLKEGKKGEHDKFREKLNSDTDEKARFKKAERFWRRSPAELAYILEAYDEKPLNMIVRAIREDKNYIKGLMLPERRMHGEAYLYRPEPRDFKVDDLAYFIHNAEPIAKQWKEEVASYQK